MCITDYFHNKYVKWNTESWQLTVAIQTLPAVTGSSTTLTHWLLVTVSFINK
jgi:hypothetical protein